MNLLKQLLQLPRPLKRLVSLTADAGALLIALAIAYCLECYFNMPSQPLKWLGVHAALVVGALAVFTKLGLYRAVVRYVSPPLAG